MDNRNRGARLVSAITLALMVAALFASVWTDSVWRWLLTALILGCVSIGFALVASDASAKQPRGDRVRKKDDRDGYRESMGG